MLELSQDVSGPSCSHRYLPVCQTPHKCPSLWIMCSFVMIPVGVISKRGKILCPGHKPVLFGWSFPDNSGIFFCVYVHVNL